MSWKCFLFGHAWMNFEIINELQGSFRRSCARCSDIHEGIDHSLVGIAAMHRRDSMQKMAWDVLHHIIPETFYKEPGKTKHTLTYRPNGQTVFTVDLGEHPLSVLEIYKKNLYEVEPEFLKWDIRPLLKLVKD